jgi:hypothetical protein
MEGPIYGSYEYKWHTVPPSLLQLQLLEYFSVCTQYPAITTQVKSNRVGALVSSGLSLFISTVFKFGSYNAWATPCMIYRGQK